MSVGLYILEQIETMTLFSIWHLQILITAPHVQEMVGVWFKCLEQVSQNVNAILAILGTCVNVSIFVHSGDKINFSFQLKS